MRKVAQMQAGILADFERFALTVDLNPSSLMRRVGIDPRLVEKPELSFPVRSWLELNELTSRISGMDDFGLRFAEYRGLPDLGPVILMLREEDTFGQALRTMIAFLQLHMDTIYLHLDESCDPIFTIDLMLENRGKCRQVIESGLASITNLMRWLIGQDWSPAAICFRHSRPASIARHNRFFRCPVEFLHEVDAIVLRPEDLSKRLPTSSPVTRRQVERYIQSIGVASTDIYVHRVTQVVAMALSRGEAAADVVAGYLGSDRRTLNRRLARSGLNYSAVLENVRRNVAVQHMLGSDRHLSDISGLVGFDTLRAFSRWFHQSFGSPPSAWRASRRNQ